MARYEGRDIEISTDINIPKTIYKKIGEAVDLDIEGLGVRPFRELLQNADDARATTLTMRFDKDMLLVHNDGYTIEHRFVEAMSKMLDSDKENDPETSGNFGSGFRSTYIFTDTPQLEWWDFEKKLVCPACKEPNMVSSNISNINHTTGMRRQLKCGDCGHEGDITDFTDDGDFFDEAGNPYIAFRVYQLPLGVLESKLDWVKPKKDTPLKSAFELFGRDSRDQRELDVKEHGHSRLGVVFRFPWRRKNVFRDAPGWSQYEWNLKGIRQLAHELRDYAAKALLGCRHLKTVRIVMAGCAKEGDRWDFTATRDITISEIREAVLDDYYDPRDTGKLPVMTILRTSFDRNDAFFDVDETSGSWKRTLETGHQWYDYRDLYREAEESEEGKEIPWRYRAFSSQHGVQQELAEELGFWDFQTILMPLFSKSPKLPVYTPIPLAGDSPNHFAIVGALPPMENRLFIDVGGDKKKEWLQEHINTAASVYKSALIEHQKFEFQELEELLNLLPEDIAAEEAKLELRMRFESIQLACLPRDAPNRWFGVGGGLHRIAEVTHTDMVRHSPMQMIYDAINKISDVSVVTPGGALTPLHECIYHRPDPDDDRLEEILSIIEAPVLSEGWMGYLSEVKQNSAPVFFELVIEALLLEVRNNGCMSTRVPEQLARMVRANWEKARDSGKLKKASELLLDGICKVPLVDEWKQLGASVLKIPCVISQDNRLRTIPKFVDTNKCPDLVHILPDSQLVKEEDRDSTISMIFEAREIEGVSEAIKPTGLRILKLIDQDTSLNPEVHDDLSSHDDVHKAVSKLLRVAFGPTDNVRNNLNSKEVRNLRFVPCRRHGRVVTLQINNIRMKSRGVSGYGVSYSDEVWGYDSLSSAHYTLSSLYHREFIFKNRPEALDDLPECIVDRLRFLEMHKKVESKRVVDVLKLNAIGQGSKKGSKMTNLVRTLLFEHDLNAGIAHSQPSLFREGELGSWLSDPPMHLGSAESRPVCPGCDELMQLTPADGNSETCCDEACDVSDITIAGFGWHCGSCVKDFCVGCGSPEPKQVDYDSEEVKRQLITSLLAPYGEVISEGLGLKDAKDVVPFVLGTGGTWRTGSSYCLALDPSLSNLIDDIDAIDPEFRNGLTDGILGQLGVQGSLGPKAAMPAIKARIDDETKLALLMLSLLSSERNWADCGNDADEEAWVELTTNLKWAPTNGAGVLYPSQVLYPSEDHVSKLGENYTHFPPKSMWGSLRQTNEAARAKDLGMRQTLDLAVLVLAISGMHTSGNDVVAAVKELHTRLLKLKDDFPFDQLEWGPHAPVDGIKLSLTDGGSVNSSDSLWITDDYDRAQLLGRVFNDKTVIPIDQLEHVDRTNIIGIRRMDILKKGPEWHEVLARLTEVQSPIIVQELWSLLLELDEVPDDIARRLHGKLFDGDSDVMFCLDAEAVVVHKSLLITNIEDEHGDKEVDERTRYYVKDGSIQEDWFGLLGVEWADQLDPGKVLRALIGELYDPSDPEKASDLIKVKSLMAECVDGFYVPVWDPAGVRILDLHHEEAMHPGPDYSAIHPDFRRFPIIHRTAQDPPSFADWVGTLGHPNLTLFMDIMSIGTEPLEEDYSVHDPLQDAVKQVIEALSMIHPAVFKDSSSATVPCMIGSGGIPYVMSATWDGQNIQTVFDTERNGCIYDENNDTLTLVVDEDDDYGNPYTSSQALVVGLRDKAPWYPELKVRDEQSSGAFCRRLLKLIRYLLESDTEDWFTIEIDNRDYGRTLARREWAPHGRLFESHSQLMMTQKLKSWYTGCQICSLVTPRGEHTDETQESLIHTIRLSGSHYRGKRDHSRPLGRQLWVCARHRILWDRRLVRFCFIIDAFDNQYEWRVETLPKDIKKIGIERLKKMNTEWQEGDPMKMMVYDQEVVGFGQEIAPQWQGKDMRVKKEHAQAILEQMVGWIS